MLDSKAYKEYYTVASGAEPPKAKIKYKKKADEPITSSKSKTAPASKGSRLKSSAKVAKTTKKKQPTKMPKTKGLAILFEVALSEAEQIKLATKRSKKDFHMSHASGSGDGIDIQSKVPDELLQKDDADEETNVNDDTEETESDNDGDDLTHLNLSTYKADDEEEEEEKEDDDDVVSSDNRVYTPPEHQLTDEEVNQEGDDEVKKGEEEQQQEEELYGDLNINLQRSDAKMTDAEQENVQGNQVTEDTHVILTTVPPALQQRTISLIPRIVDNYLASKMKEAVDVAVQLQTNKLREEAQAENQEFLNQTSYVVAASLSEFELKKIFIDKIEEHQSVNRSDIQKNIYNVLVKLYNYDKDIFSSYGDVVTLKRGRDDQDNDEDPFAGSNRGSKRRRSNKEAESSKEPTHKESKSTSSSKDASRSQPKSSGKFAHAKEHGQKVDDLEDQSHQEFNIRNDDETFVREALDVDESQWNPSSSLTPDREWHKTKTVDNRPPQPWITQMAQATDTQSLFNEFLATPIDFSAFIINRLKIDNLTQEILTGPTYDLIKGTYKSVVELEYHLEEVFKATRAQVKKYTTSITKTKAADYGQKFYRYASNMETSKDVYSRHMVIAVTSLDIMKYFGYSHLEEIIVRRQDDQLYKFREGDFIILRRQDTKDMLLLLVQSKLSNLNLEEWYAMNVALRMFTRRIVVQKYVEDLQLGVESYQKKINLTRPETYHSDPKE
nr:hypothetical protein [Tanacetum cinerariifolium]